jgi:hypothetical protein
MSKGAIPKPVLVVLLSGQPFYAKSTSVGSAKVQQGGIGKNVHAAAQRRGVSGSALVGEFGDGEDVEGDWIAAEPEFVHGGGVVKESPFFALVLGDERVDDVEDEVIGDGFEGKDFGNRGGEAVRIGFEAERIVDATESETVQAADDASEVVVEEWRDVDDFGHVGRDEAAEEGTAAGVIGFFAEFVIAVDEFAEESGFVELLFVEAGFHGAGHSNAEPFGEVKPSSLAKVSEAAVPDGNLFGRNTRVDQSLGDRFDHRATCAAGARGGIDFDANFVVCGNETEPGGFFVGLAGEGGDAVLDHAANGIGLRDERDRRGGIFNDEDAAHPGVWVESGFAGAKLGQASAKQNDRQRKSHHLRRVP